MITRDVDTSYMHRPVLPPGTVLWEGDDRPVTITAADGLEVEPFGVPHNGSQTYLIELPDGPTRASLPLPERVANMFS